MVVGGDLDPRREAGDQPAERFEVRHLPAIGAGRLLDRHPGLQRSGGEVAQHRIGQAPHHADPQRTVGLAGCTG